MYYTCRCFLYTSTRAWLPLPPPPQWTQKTVVATTEYWWRKIAKSTSSRTNATWYDLSIPNWPRHFFFSSFYDFFCGWLPYSPFHQQGLKSKNESKLRELYNHRYRLVSFPLCIKLLFSLCIIFLLPLSAYHYSVLLIPVSRLVTQPTFDVPYHPSSRCPAQPWSSANMYRPTTTSAHPSVQKKRTENHIKQYPQPPVSFSLSLTILLAPLPLCLYTVFPSVTYVRCYVAFTDIYILLSLLSFPLSPCANGVPIAGFQQGVSSTQISLSISSWTIYVTPQQPSDCMSPCLPSFPSLCSLQHIFAPTSFRGRPLRLAGLY